MKLRARCREIQRVALYLRVSTDEQAQGHSLDSQHQELTDWARLEGWEVAEIYEDAGASGTTVAGRTSFLRMVRDAQAGAFDAILVLRVDRFARSVRDSAVYRELLSDCGVQLKSKTEPTVGDDTPAGFLTNGMFDVMAAYYSILLSSDVARGMRTRALKGLPVGDIPFGYSSTSADEPPKIVPAEAEAVRNAFEQYAGGNRSMLEIAGS